MTFWWRVSWNVKRPPLTRYFITSKYTPMHTGNACTKLTILTIGPKPAPLVGLWCCLLPGKLPSQNDIWKIVSLVTRHQGVYVEYYDQIQHFAILHSLLVADCEWKTDFVFALVVQKH